MLLYWESRFDKDETMAKLVAAMSDYVRDSSADNLNVLRSLADKQYPDTSFRHSTGTRVTSSAVIALPTLPVIR